MHRDPLGQLKRLVVKGVPEPIPVGGKVPTVLGVGCPSMGTCSVTVSPNPWSPATFFGSVRQ